MTGPIYLKPKLLFLLAALCLCSPLNAARKKKADTSSETSSESSLSKGDAIKITPKKRTYFYKIDQEILAGVENGSPDSIRASMQKIRKNDSEYADNEKVLIAVASNIMQMVWPSEKITWEIPEAPLDNPYMGALESAKQGIFDSSTGNVDFLTVLLPAFVVFTPGLDTSIYESCKACIRAALTLRPDSILANYLMAYILEKESNYTDIETYLAQAYGNSPTTEEIALAYVRILRRNNNLELAKTILDGLSKGDDNLSILKQNAYIAFDTGDLQSAELYVARVLQQNPNDLEFLLFRVKVLIEKNDYIHAVSLLDVYARQEAESIDYLLLRAKVQLDWSKNTNAATETVEKAINLYPENSQALMFAARISSVTDAPVAGKYADDLASQVLAKDPDNQDAMLYALKGLIKRENWKEAYEISKKLIIMPSVNSEVVSMYVETCLQLGKNMEAYEYARRQLDTKPNDELILQAYILAYTKIGSRDMVLKYIENLMSSSSPKMKSYLYYRRSFLQLTEDSTLADLRSSLISNPRNDDALFRLYELYFNKKDYRKAQYYLRQVVAINPNDNSVKQLNEALTKLMQ
ncbi:MAG: tetratricopeptide repeat protein [Treponema sp.]|nr:tetratricopeptide repeat protein [Treponema sp.]